jgi:hypothetical protein
MLSIGFVVSAGGHERGDDPDVLGVAKARA